MSEKIILDFVTFSGYVYACTKQPQKEPRKTPLGYNNEFSQ